MADQWDAQTLREYIDRMYQEDAPGVIESLNRWLARGDGVAVYVNKDLGHPELGMPRLVSYGSKQSLLETDEPAERLADMPGQINWRYQLEATYRGGMMPVPVGPFDVDMSPAAPGPEWEMPDAQE